MPWSTPPNPVNLVDSIDATHIVALSNDVSYLAARPLYHSVYQNAGADYSLTATAWADVDNTNLIAPITIGLANARVYVEFQFIMSAITGGTTTIFFDISDGTSRSAGTNGVLQTSYTGLQRVWAYFSGVAAGAKTYKLQYQVAASVTATVKRSSFPIIIDVQEK